MVQIDEFIQGFGSLTAPGEDATGATACGKISHLRGVSTKKRLF